MSDKNRPLGDYSQDKNYYEEPPSNPNPLERISEPKVPGVFRIRNKQNNVIPTSAEAVLKRASPSIPGIVNVGMEIGNNNLEAQQKIKNQLRDALKLLEFVKEKGVVAEKRGSDFVVEIDPKLFAEEDARIEELEEERKLLAERQPFIARFAILSFRNSQISEHEEYNNLDQGKRNDVYNLIDSLEWLSLNPTNKKGEGASALTDKLNTLEERLNDLEKDLEKIREATKRMEDEKQIVSKEFPDIFFSFAELQSRVKGIIPNLESSSTFKHLAVSFKEETDELQELKEQLTSSRSQGDLDNFKRALALYTNLVDEIVRAEKEVEVERVIKEKEGKIWKTLNIEVKRIKLEKGKWKIKKEGSTSFEEMSPDQFAAWKPIHETLVNYKTFMGGDNTKVEAKAYDFMNLVATKNSLLGLLKNAVSPDDFLEADTKARELGQEIKRAKQIQDEVRKYNLETKKRGYVLTPEGTDFSFISFSGPHPRVIDEDGDWVLLNEKDRQCMEHARTALANFRARESTPYGIIDKKDEILRLINEYSFEEASTAADQYLEEFGKASKINKGGEVTPEGILLLDIFSGWPNAIKLISAHGNTKDKTFRPAFWQITRRDGTTEQLSDPESWSQLKANFDENFRKYSDFFKGKDSQRKAEECKNLIKIKNEIVTAILKLNKEKAFVLIDLFGRVIESTTEEWGDKISEETKVAEKEKKLESEQKALRTLFEEENKKYDALVAQKDSLFHEITSDDEKKMLNRHFEALKGTRESIEREFKTKQEVNEGTIQSYGENFDLKNPHSVASIVATIETRLNKIYGTNKQSGLLRSTLPKPGMVMLRKGGQSSISVEDWQKEQKEKQDIIKRENEIKGAESARDLVTLHNNLLNKDHQEYLNTYLYKEWVYGDPEKKVVVELIENYYHYLERTYKSTLVEKTAFETQLAVEKNPVQIKVIEQELNRLNERIASILPVMHQIEQAPHEKIKKELHTKNQATKTLTSVRETYDPSLDSSIVDIGRERPTLRHFRSRVDFDLARRGRSKDAQQRNARLAEEIENKKNMTDEEFAAKRGEEGSLLSERKVPNHYEGMVRPLTVENGEGDNHKNTESVAERAITHKETEGQVIKKEAQEKNKLRAVAVNKLNEAINAIRTKKYGRNWRVIAVATVVGAASAGAGFYLLGDKEKEKGAQKVQTLEQVISWRGFLTSEETEFLKDLTSDTYPNFISFMEKKTPLVNIDHNNPSTIQSLSKMECNELLNRQGVVYGLTPEQRTQVCAVVRNLENIIQATDKGKRGFSKLIASPYIYVDHTMNLENFYALVRQAINDADKLEAARKK